MFIRILSVVGTAFLFAIIMYQHLVLVDVSAANTLNEKTIQILLPIAAIATACKDEII